jgi:hypothetical protein
MSAELIEQLPEFIRGHQLATIPEQASGNDDEYDTAHVPSEDIAEAHIILSAEQGKTGMHRPVLDIDFPAALIPSSTPGHFHLYLDKLIPEPDYMRLLDALAEAGIIEPGYASVSEARGYTSARLPWVKKAPKPEVAA